jgi:tRNA(Ile)-lysidine synthase
MVERFKAHIATSGLIPEGATVLVGYSGGGDSTCLLDLLRQCGVDVIAAHLHHGQRPEADKELELCAAFCQQIGVPFMSGRADVPRLARETGTGLEEAGRHARYEFFEQCLAQAGADLVATAHTLDDHVETVLLNLARGTGLRGLAGIQAKRGSIVRPLLPFSRAETRTYCEERGLWFHDDPANDDESFARVRVRKRIVPEIEAINSAAKSAVARLAQIADEEDRFLDGMAAAALEQCEDKPNGPLFFLSKDVEASFDRSALSAIPGVLFDRGIRLVTGALGAPFDSSQVSAVSSGLEAGNSGSVTAEGGEVVIEWTASTVTARRLVVDAPYRFPLTVPGETTSDEFGWVLTAESTGPEEYQREPKSLDVVLDARALKGQLYFRSYEPGDTVTPLGFSGTKEVRGVLSDMGLTDAAKRRLPIVCDLVGPVWIPGGCIADRAKVTAESKDCLRLKFGPI